MRRSNIRPSRTGIPGDAEGKGGIYNFVTKRADCRGDRAKVSWTQVETGSAITWKYPSCVLRGDGSQGEFYSIAITNGRQQADTGTKMIHPRPRYEVAHHLKRHLRRAVEQHLPWPRLQPPQGDRRPQLHPVRQPTHRQAMRRPHRALRGSQERPLHLRARSHHHPPLRRPAVLLPATGPRLRRSGRSPSSTASSAT